MLRDCWNYRLVRVISFSKLQQQSHCILLKYIYIMYLYNVFMESIHVTPCVVSIAARMTFLSIWPWASHSLEALNGTNSRVFSLCVNHSVCAITAVWDMEQPLSRRMLLLLLSGLIKEPPQINFPQWQRINLWNSTSFFLSFTWKGEWEAVHVCRNTVPGGKQTKYSFSTADLPVTTYWQQWHSRPMLHSSAFVEHNSCSVYSSPRCPRLRSLYSLGCQGIVTSSSHSTVHLENRQ